MELNQSIESYRAKLKISVKANKNLCAQAGREAERAQSLTELTLYFSFHFALGEK